MRWFGWGYLFRGDGKLSCHRNYILVRAVLGFEAKRNKRMIPSRNNMQVSNSIYQFWSPMQKHSLNEKSIKTIALVNETNIFWEMTHSSMHSSFKSRHLSQLRLSGASLSSIMTRALCCV